ncbi:MAG: hypothetical protein MJ214_04950 [Bacilli bacterium]|nr:hypothetical protein [Bacilli bacterium]
MAKQIFREKSLKKLEQNDELNAYVKVVHPTIWISLGIIVALLAGYMIWGFLGRIEIKVVGVGEVKNNELINYIKKDYFYGVEVDQTIKFANKSCKITTISSNPVEVTPTSFSDYLIKLGGLTIGEYVYECKANIEIKDGCYITQTITDIVAPLPYVFR